ncbi:MAG TPA: LacI family DNA-binding transcriptional regulator [Actinophytocola sp.]|uniref:LacI family DNA-binding transcriptional regulator n=1 Tax=Actinophytocola sp. TaxID=1872138 RepID=UPI002DDD5F06|nr:LacI family DNA-binding transcriptional regulator [Actinophytocola sp.]HEV2780480.1 LacI family DNA-binding transcriptional regulator [Actinophytocola sp.]
MSQDRGRRPTLDTIALELGVSRATVSNAYNRPDQLSAELRERIIATARRLGYPGPDPTARSLATRRSGSVAVMLCDGLSSAFSDPALSIMLDALASTVDSGDRALLLLPGVDGAGPRAQSVMRAQTDVVVAYSLVDDAPSLEAVRARKLPLVVVDEPVVPGSARVEVADETGAALAARHVVSLGHRRIGVLAFELSADGHHGPAGLDRIKTARFRVTRDRIAGYWKGLAEHGIPTDEVPLWEAPGSGREIGTIGARWLLERHPRPTALLCMSDELAIGAVRAAHDLGLAVPADVSVVGFDDTPAASWSSPPLTTVRQDLLLKGRTAGDLALRMLNGERPGPPITLGVTLVARASTAPPAAPM